MLGITAARVLHGMEKKLFSREEASFSAKNILHKPPPTISPVESFEFLLVALTSVVA